MSQYFIARLLDPLQYHSFVDSGAGGATATAPFLGDIALAFAINAAVLGRPLPERRWVHGKWATGPDYKADLAAIGLVPTVGVAEGDVERLPPEFQASSYMSEGFQQTSIDASSMANTSWRPWRQAQLLSPGNEFHVGILRGPNLPRSFAIRMGTGRSCLISLCEAPRPQTVTLNAWSARALHERNVEELPCSMREYSLAQYSLMHGVPTNKAEEAFG